MEGKYKAPYPVIDTDPYFFRVIRYFRLSDLGVAAAVTALGPGFMYWMERYQPSGNPGRPLHRAMKVAGVFGVFAGFLSGYARVSARFQGLSENAREIKKYRQEYAKLKAQGKSLHGESQLPLQMQRTAAGYSTNAYFNFDVFPWFNFASHPYHGRSKGVLPEED